MNRPTRCSWAVGKLLIHYHDEEWGVPVRDDVKLFEALMLEAFQTGLKWEVVLAKRENFRRAFDGFDPHKIAQYGEEKIAALMQDKGLIRNRRKMEAAVRNARCYLIILWEYGSFAAYLDSFTEAKATPCDPDEVVITSPLSDAISRDLKKRGMQFVGSVVVQSFLQAVGVVNGHEPGCFLQADAAAEDDRIVYLPF